MAGMSQKNIKLKIRNKLNDWIDSIDCKRTQGLMHNHAMVSGGAIASFLMGDKVNDYDVYLDSVVAAQAIADYYIQKAGIEDATVHVCTSGRVQTRIESSGKYEVPDDVPEGERFYPVFITDNAITLSDDIQIVTRFVGEIDKIHENFDFVHATCTYHYATNELVCPPEALHSMMCKQLRYNGSLYPLCSIFRLRKFLKRDWTIDAGQIVKIAFQISELDLSDPSVLAEQCVGVDMTYINALIEALESTKKQEIEFNYLCEIIDRIFE